MFHKAIGSLAILIPVACSLLISGCGGSAPGGDAGTDAASDAGFTDDGGGTSDAGKDKDGGKGRDGGGIPDGGGWTDGGPVLDCAKVESVFNAVLGRPTSISVAVSVLAEAGTQVFYDYGTDCDSFPGKTGTASSISGEPIVTEMTGLQPDTRYFYRLHYKKSGDADYTADNIHTFHTARVPGKSFNWAIQGDSHPERDGKMFDPGLYSIHMQNVAGGFPDFFFWLGDDFSIDPMIDSGKLSPANVDAVYLNQRGYVGAIGGTVPVFPVNGNHEEGAAYLLTPEYSTPYAQAPIYAGSSRVKYFALPGTDGFYSADSKEVSGVGKIRDYYAFTWGDALFVTIDPYWHSPVPVDNGVPGVTPPKDGWEATMGDDQYEWFKSTLEGSKAKYKFVLAHHVNGTGRGGAAIAHEYEWGGYDQAGKTYEFTSRRPAWSKPIHQLMKDSNVTIFFFGHDHLFAREKVDSVVYQSVPCPADNTYAAFNSDAYDPATITFPGAEYDPDYGAVVTNAGHLNVTVAPDRVTVDYVRSVLPGDEAKAGAANGQISYSYSVTAE